MLIYFLVGEFYMENVLLYPIDCETGSAVYLIFLNFFFIILFHVLFLFHEATQSKAEALGSINNKEERKLKCLTKTLLFLSASFLREIVFIIYLYLKILV